MQAVSWVVRNNVEYAHYTYKIQLFELFTATYMYVGMVV